MGSGGHELRGYPALVDEGATVGVRVLTSPAAQARAMRAGTRRLLQLTVASPRKAMERSLGNDVKLALARLRAGTVGALQDDVVAASIDALVATHGGPARDADGFGTLQEAVRQDLPALAAEVAGDAARVVVAAAAGAGRLDALVAPALQPAVADARSQLTRLAGAGFVQAAGCGRLGHLLRYVRALDRRLEKLASDPVRDGRALRIVHELEDAYAAAMARLPPDGRTAAHDELVWMLEELRVSLFAQQLGTAYAVSEQRLRREIRAVADLGR